MNKLTVLDRVSFLPIKRNVEWNEIVNSINQIEKDLAPVYEFLKQKERELPLLVVEYSVLKNMKYATNEAKQLVQKMDRLMAILNREFIP